MTEIESTTLFYEYGARAMTEEDLATKLGLELDELSEHEHYSHFIEGRLDAKFQNNGAVRDNALSGNVPAQKEFADMLREAEEEE